MQVAIRVTTLWFYHGFNMAVTTVKQILNAEYVKRISIETIDGQIINGILSECRVGRELETEDKFIYDIRHTDNDWCEPATLENFVWVNWYGSIIVDTPIQFPEEPYLEITNYSIEEYEPPR